MALFDADGHTVDAVTFGRIHGSIIHANNGWTLGRPTFGTANEPVALADTTALVINEWMAFPEEGGSDWIELYNPHPTAPALITGLHIRVGQEIGGLHRIAAIPPKAISVCGST